LVATGRRRTPGLRREEVAKLAGVSLTWYTWLEQGRNINVSEQVLNSIARALGLTATERRHLFLLAGENPPPDAGSSRLVGEDTQHFLDLLDPCPSWVFDGCFDIIAWNKSAAALLVNIEGRKESELNALWLMFNDPGAKTILPDWEREARRLVGLLRAESARQLGNPRFVSLLAELLRTSPSFRDLWEAHDVVPFSPSVRRFNHPRVGLITLRYVKFGVADEPDKSVITHFAPLGSRDHELLLRLVADPAQARPA
jgi:transcriptional regulator with XRE-family HTH domain